jgi:hypothetical protein
MLFVDVPELLPKRWFVKEHITHVNAISCVFLEVLDTACCMSVSSVSIANYTVSKFYKSDDVS